jgi:hypothetical protein
MLWDAYIPYAKDIGVLRSIYKIEQPDEYKPDFRELIDKKGVNDERT